MDFSWIWQTILIFVVGISLLRLGGRKSISQLTIPVTVIMIAIGTLLIQPVTGRGIWVTFGVATLLALLLFITEYLQVRFDDFETLMTGKSVMVIENGQINKQNLKKLRLTVDKLELRLRQMGIAQIHDVEWATIEVSGQLGYQLKPEKQLATKEDIQQLMKWLQTSRGVEPTTPMIRGGTTQENLFTEVASQRHPSPPPKDLQ